jgi:23S rRNA (guanine745-N1)-methyltransferase
MFELRCTVRNCSHRLERRENALFCAAGHHFDRTKYGYWNLLQPQDKKSLDPGDSEDAVLARHRWLERGYGHGLVTALRTWVEAVGDKFAKEQDAEEQAAGGQLADSQIPSRVLDLGCGEGTFGAALFSGPRYDYCGIDMARRAIRIANRRWPEATWVLANGDRILPVSDESVRQVVSLFGRRPAAEIARVLVDDGDCIVAVPGADDLIELRERVQQAGHQRSRWEAIVEEFSRVGLELVEHQNWSEVRSLEPDAIADALAMTYRAVRRSQNERANELTAMDVTLAADLMRFRNRR